MKICRVACFLLSVWSLSLTSQAAERKSSRKVSSESDSGSYQEPYGMAGCGLYTYIIQDKSKGAQLAMWALKSLLFPDFQTSAITSGTSNCVESRAGYAAQEQEVFITVNLANLSKEAAQGQGEHLNALAEVFGCPHSEFSSLSQTQYKEIYSDYEPNAVLANYRRAMSADEHLSQSCLRAG